MRSDDFFCFPTSISMGISRLFKLRCETLAPIRLDTSNVRKRDLKDNDIYEYGAYEKTKVAIHANKNSADKNQYELNLTPFINAEGKFILTLGHVRKTADAINGGHLTRT